MIEYNVGNTKMEMAEEDILLGKLFYHHQLLFENYIQEYINEVEKLASNIYLSKSTLEKYRTMMKNAKSDIETVDIENELFDIYRNFGSITNNPIEDIIEKIYEIFCEFAQRVKKMAQEKMLGNQSDMIEKSIDEYQKKIGQKKYSKTDKHLSFEQWFERMGSSIDVDDEYEIYRTFAMNPQKGVFRKYYAYSTDYFEEEDRGRDIEDVDFLITCVDENTRRKLIGELRDDIEFYLLYMLGKLSEKCDFMFSRRLYSWKEHEKVIEERNQIFKMFSQGDSDIERMIENIVRFPLDPYQYVLWERTFNNLTEWETAIAFYSVNLKMARERFDEYIYYLNIPLLEENHGDDILECIQNNIDTTDGWTAIGEDLKNTSPRQYQKAKINLGIKEDEDVFMLADGTLFKSFKEGFAVCSSGIYLSTASGKLYKSWEDAKNCKIEAGHGSNIRIDGIEVFTFADVNKCVNMFEDIKYVLSGDEKEIREEPITIDNNTECKQVRFCSECGEKIQEGAKFCQYCGNKVAVSSSASNNDAKTKFNVELTSAGNDKVKVIKIIRDTTNLELKQAIELVDSVPRLFREGVSKEEANYLKEQLQNVGATVTIK